MKPKLLFLESLRGIAALAVALFHIKNVSTSPITDNLFIENGDTMVDFFFVLSGFVISYTYMERIYDFTSLINFQIKRFLRLYPLHVLTLLIFLGIEIAKYLFENNTGVASNIAPFSTNNLTSFITNLFLIHSFTEATVTFNAPSWSISTEFYAYLIFGFVLVFSSKMGQRYRTIFCLIVFLTSALLVYIFDAMEEFVGVAMYRCLYSFFLGTMVFYIYNKVSIKTPVLISLTIVVFSIWAVCHPETVHKMFLPLLFGLIIYCLSTSEENFFVNFLNSKILVFLGTVSYGIYMVHYGVWWVYQQILKFIFDFETITFPDGTTVLTMEPLESSLVVVTGITIIILLSWLSYKFVEVPFNNLRHKIKIQNRKTTYT